MVSLPQYLDDNSVSALLEQIKQLPRSNDDIVLLLVGEHSTIDIEQLLSKLNEHQIPVVGGIFPGIIHGVQTFDVGIVVDILPTLAKPIVVTGLGSTGFHLGDVPVLLQDEQYTALVLVDGLSKHITLFLERLFGQLGNTVRYIGGGAGSLSFEQKPVVFDNHGIYQDAGLIILLNTATTLGVRHGWGQLRGPLIATKTNGTMVHKLGSRPAFQAYSQIVKQISGQTLTRDNFFSIAKEYPLGIFHSGMDFIVRDPISFTDDGALICVGEVKKNSLIYVLQGNKRSLTDNANLAVKEAMENTTIGQHNMIVDCISRALYLEDDFNQELDAVHQALPANAVTPYGMLSLGEIASFKTGRVEFFNKTFVMGSMINAN